MKYVLFAGSLRKDSLNKKLVKEAGRLLKVNHSAEIEFIDLQPLNIPLYDGDIESSSGIPEGIKTLAAKIKAADGIVISSPEYNHTISSVLKNTIDWLSRMKPVEVKHKPTLILGLSMGPFGAARSIYSNKIPFEALGALVYPTTITLPNAGDAFDEQGKLKEERSLKNLSSLMEEFNTFAGRK